jgi:hypothetical protein
MSSIAQLEVGYYENVEHYSPVNPTKAAFDWTTDVGCSAVQGWFAVDAITYANGMLTALDLRFEQHCDGDVPALHGQIHYAGP